ncbi:lipopolysaccharide biosynthesis protein [Haloarcula onubensis]|uniref:Polysaccharide biosynthesis C-terminal domain-containing protein n=1 Tax=Haloarcula onubensis TaxID=2950539 RepID=A0ABU2FNA2_9EURY|nr:polysaccharide biosynthesis C-terminal domain-containing protein [Halomicroarcula sp. S3CR25-11]MDS0281737.1 polysaccharide biosynthesis C-terminal domain-containing protein [Halomicroarcula sp. S3CR25-11]
MRLGKTAASHFLSQVVVTLAGFGATWLIAYVLGADGLGRYSVIVSLGFFWLVIPGSAVSSAMKKRISEGDSPGGFIGGGILLNLVACGLLSGLVLASGELLGGVVSRDRELMRVLIDYDLEIVALLSATLAYQTMNGSLQGQKRVAATGWLKAVERIARTAFQAGALVFSLGVAGISLGHAAALAIVAAVAFTLGTERPTLPTRAQVSSLLEYAKFAWVGSLRGRVFGWLDTIFLSFFVGASLIGIYEAAWGIASMLAIASASISQTLFPEVSDLSTDEGYDRIRHYLDEALAFSGIFIIPGLAGAAIIGQRVLEFYRPEFGQGSTVLLVLIAAYMADTFASQFTNVINGVDRPDAAFRVNVVFILVNAVLNGVLIWWMGWYGAAIATAVSSWLRAVVGYVVLRRIIDEVSVPVGQLARQALAAVLMAAVVYPVVPFAPSGRLGTVLLAGLGAVVYATLVLALAPRVRTKARMFFPPAA